MPFLGFIFLVIFGGLLSNRSAAVIGVGSIFFSALLSAFIAFDFITLPPPGGFHAEELWRWVSVGDLQVQAAFRLDALSLTMMATVSWVGFLIHLYSAEFMADDDGYVRFFAYMNLFVGSMLTLVLADNLLLLYLGWEGVGLCSYLLIGFWYKDPYNGYAARKAFIVTRIGDAALAVSLFLIFNKLGTLDIQEVMKRAADVWGQGGGLAVAASGLFLIGALGKSAQLPLQTWLPDAMAGPTPVSALIHAATMVTAGVYLIARTHLLFELAPIVMAMTALIGAATMLIAASSALTQTDIKRVLAYSTMSQVGYMFLALGVGAWDAAVFHFMTHAFFKALLFLAAGVIIFSLHEHDIFKMGGLRKKIPFTFWTFAIGAASLSALPFITAGYYSKEMIFEGAWASGNTLLWAAGILGAFLTALYAFRLFFLVFLGEPKKEPAGLPGMAMKIPLAALAALSLTAGFLETPEALGGAHFFSTFMEPVFSSASVFSVAGAPVAGLAAVLAPVGGLLAAYLIFLKRPEFAKNITASPFGAALGSFWSSGWGFDGLYDFAFVRPFKRMALMTKNDLLDHPYSGFAALLKSVNGFLVYTQAGKVRWYAIGMALGAALALSILVFL